jgi:hypothetical protein
MFLTKKHLPRRTFLQGAGVMLALPFLEAMVPARALAGQSAAAQTKTRFTGIFVPHGMAPGYWVPGAEGAGFEFPMILKPLEPFRDSAIVMSGLWSQSAEPPPGVTGADHWVASAYLCATKPKKTAGADVLNGVTIDQVIAQKIGGDTLLPSLQLAVEDPGANSSNCGEGYSCAYTNSISWPTQTRPLPMEINPQVVFQRLFGDGSTPEERAQRRRDDESILDSIADKLARFRRDIGGSISTWRTSAKSSDDSRSRRRRRQRCRRRRCRTVCRRASTSTSSCSTTCSRWRSRVTSPVSRRCCMHAT